MFLEFLVLAATAGLCLYLWQSHAHSYWKRQNIKYIQPKPFVGNMGDVFMVRKNLNMLFYDIYKDTSLKNDPLVGLYTCTRPVLLIRDPELIKRVLIKDFSEFANRASQADHRDVLGSNNLFFVGSSRWRIVRPKLTPVFTSGKIKQMYPLMTEIGRSMEALLDTFDDNSIIDVKSMCYRFTNELIGTIAFGIQSNSLRNPDTDFYRHSIAVFQPTVKRAIDFFSILLMPKLASLLRVKLFSESTSKFMSENLLHIISERERTGAKRNDLIDALVGMKKEALANPTPSNPALDNDFLVAQAAVFQTAGFETSASTLTFALYELALHPEIQDRLRVEIRGAFAECDNEEGEISYEKVQELPYLGQVVDETLRKYPILAFLEREYRPTDSSKGFSLAPYNNFVLPPGMPIYISVLGLQRNEEYWPEPDKFDPERFARENRHNLNMNTYLPFGTGPRNCIGMRIGLLEVKMGLLHMLRNYRVLPCEKTPKVIEFDSRSFALTSSTPISLRLKRVAN